MERVGVGFLGSYPGLAGDMIHHPKLLQTQEKVLNPLEIG